MILFHLLLSVFMLAPLFSATKEELLISHVKQSFALTLKGQSKLNKDVLAIPGMSSPLNRRLLNNLCSLPDTSYLEIGCWQGSTLVSALFGNEATVLEAIAMDNWSEFGAPKESFLANIKKFIPMAPLTFIETDSFACNKKYFETPVTVYFYDGHHSEESHRRAFVDYDGVFADVFIAIVDDWNWEQVRSGTLKAFSALGYKVLHKEERFSRYNGDTETWWNGLLVAVIKKPA